VLLQQNRFYSSFPHGRQKLGGKQEGWQNALMLCGGPASFAQNGIAPFWPFAGEAVSAESRLSQLPGQDPKLLWKESR
jgi:hypothetical protein